jgi:hypothetical protein
VQTGLSFLTPMVLPSGHTGVSCHRPLRRLESSTLRPPRVDILAL